MVSKKRASAKSSSPLPSPNIWVVLSVAVLVVGLTIITALGPSSVTGNTVQNIGRMNKGDSFHLSVRDIPGLQTIFTNAAEIIKYGKITAEVDDSIPFDGAYMVKFKVSSENKFGPLQFTFKIKEQDLLDKGISRADLKLYSGLLEYKLQILKVDHGYIYYVVTVPKMGQYVLGKASPVAVEKVSAQKPAEKPATPIPDERQPLAGKAVGTSEEGKGFFARIAEFFRNLFS